MPEISENIMKKIKEGRQYREMMQPMGAKATEGEEQKSMIVEGHATTFNTPYPLYDFGDYSVDEQVDSHAFDECDMSDVIFQFNHEGRVFARNSNKTLNLSIDANGLLVRADLSMASDGEDLYNDIKNGLITRMSFGFTVAEDKLEYTEDKANGKIKCLRTITKIGKLYDVSAVSIPANDGTDISARSFCDGVISEIKAERLERAKRAKEKAECLKLLLF